MVLSLQGWSRKVRALLATLLLFALTLFPAPAAMASVDMVAALKTLTAYGLVKGDDQGNLQLGKSITRAEMTTILVRALGYESSAMFLASAVPFADMEGHWAAGYVQIAKNLRLSAGYPDGTFRPDQPVTYAESMAFLLRLIKKEPTSGTWPDSVVMRAAEVGIAPTGVALARVANEAAPRLDVFLSLYAGMTTVPDPISGRTLMQQLKTEPPTLVLGTLPGETTDTEVTVSGSVGSDVASVTVNGQAVTVRDGAFSTRVTLQDGANTIQVVATDLAGNQATRTAEVTKRLPIARLAISGPASVLTGASATYTVKGYDSADQEVAIPGVRLRAEGTAGSFNAETGVLQAGSGTGTMTIRADYQNVSANLSVQVVGLAVEARSLRVVTDGTLEIGKNETLTVEVLDADNQVLTTDNGRDVTLTADAGNVVISPTTAKTQNGVATFQAQAGSSGSATFTATAAGLTAGTGFIVFREPIGVRLDAQATTLEPTKTTRIRATLVNARGQSISNNTGSDVVIDLSVTGDATVDKNQIRIPRDASTSAGYDANLTAGNTDSSVVVRGTVSSNHAFTVSSASVRVLAPGVGSAYELRMLGPGTLLPNNWGLFIAQVYDSRGQLLNTGSFGFKIKVDTSTNETKTKGLPNNVTVGYGSTGNTVTDIDGKVFRTVNGAALLYVKYNGTGRVTVTPVGQSGASDIASGDGTLGTANSSTGLRMTEGAANFAPATITSFKITATSPVATRESTQGGILEKGRTTTAVTLTVTAMDGPNGTGNPIPGLSGVSVTLKRTGGSATSFPSDRTAVLSDGKATFQIAPSSDTSGTDFFRVEQSDDANINSPTFSIAVQEKNAADPTVDDSLAQPMINGIFGVSQADVETANKVLPDDKAMRLYLDPQPDGLVYVRVYRGGSLQWTSEVIDISGGNRVIEIPRSQLPNGNYTFTVQLLNAVGNSSQSPASATVALQGYLSTNISSAVFDWSSNKIIITGSGFPTSNNHKLDLTKLSIVAGNNERGLSESAYTIDSSGQVTITMGGNDLTALQNTANYSGTVTVKAEAGWISSDSGVGREHTTAQVKPAGHFDRVLLDIFRSRVYWDGKGLDTGTVDRSKFTADGVAMPTASSSWSTGSTRYVVTLSSGDNTTLKGNIADGGVAEAAQAWLTQGNNGKNRAVSNIPIYYRAEITSVNYDKGSGKLILNGIGFGGSDGNPANEAASGKFDAGKLTLVDVSTTESLSLAGYAAYSMVSDSRIEITLSAGQKADYENTNKFSGTDIYLEAAADWWKDNDTDLAAPAIPAETLRAPQP